MLYEAHAPIPHWLTSCKTGTKHMTALFSHDCFSQSRSKTSTRRELPVILLSIILQSTTTPSAKKLHPFSTSISIPIWAHIEGRTTRQHSVAIVSGVFGIQCITEIRVEGAKNYIITNQAKAQKGQATRVCYNILKMIITIMVENAETTSQPRNILN